MRAGNQAQGKTWAGLSNAIYHSIGRHPFYRVPAPPVAGYIVCASWGQSIEIQSKLWSLLPKGALDPATEYIEGHGFRGKHPFVRFRNGSLIRIKTARQGALQLAGGTIGWAMFDEPPASRRVWGEITKRVIRTNGWVWGTLTPINAPVDYLRELTESGQVEDIHGPLTPEAMIPVGQSRPIRLTDGTRCDAAWIDSIRASTLDTEEPVVVDGEWDCRAIGRLFRAFASTGPDAHVSDRVPPGDVKLCVGIDHGSGANFSSAAVLVALEPDPTHPRVWVLDEYVSEGETDERDDARGILSMLSRWGLSWDDLDHAYGDRPWRRGSMQKKSNGQLMRAIGRKIKRKPDALSPQLRTVKRGKGHGAGSVHMGEVYLHRAMVRRGCFNVGARCEQVIASLERYDGRSDSPYKHILDAIRYALDWQIFATPRRSRARIYVG